jgi:hypothetical protein
MGKHRVQLGGRERERSWESPTILWGITTNLPMGKHRVQLGGGVREREREREVKNLHFILKLPRFLNTLTAILYELKNKEKPAYKKSVQDKIA